MAAKKDPPLITAALADDYWAFSDLLSQGADIHVTDANNDTALTRVAKRALTRRVAHWFSEGEIDGVPVSYTVTDGVLVFRKRGRVVKMKWNTQLTFTEKWCPDVYAYFDDLTICNVLLYNGASLTSKGNDGKTARQHLEALQHPYIEEGIADQPKNLRWLARRAAGARRHAEREARAERVAARKLKAAKAAAARKRKTGAAKPKARRATEQSRKQR